MRGKQAGGAVLWNMRCRSVFACCANISSIYGYRRVLIIPRPHCLALVNPCSGGFVSSCVSSPPSRRASRSHLVPRSSSLSVRFLIVPVYPASLVSSVSYPPPVAPVIMRLSWGAVSDEVVVGP